MSKFKVGDRVIGNGNMVDIENRGIMCTVVKVNGTTLSTERPDGRCLLADTNKFDLYVEPSQQPTSYKDTTKAPLEELLAIPDALEAIARLFRWAHDTKGYGFKQFETIDPSELRDALMRHTFQTGIKHLEVDDQSQMLHAIHAAANGLMYVQNLINRSKAN